MQKPRSYLAAVLALALWAGLAGCASLPHEQAPGLSEAQALETAQRWAALANQADSPGLKTLLHDSYLHIHATALVENKAQFLEAFDSGARRYDPIVIEEPSVRLVGDCALINGKFKLKAFSRGRVIEGVNRFTMVVVRTPAGLRVVSFQATGIPPAK